MDNSSEHPVALPVAGHAPGLDLREQLTQHGRDLWGYLLYHVANRSDAEDLFQEVNLKALEHLHSVREPERFRPWLFSIAMNSVRSFFRRRRPESLDAREADGAPELVSSEATPQEALEREQQLLLLRACLAKLPERDREILLLEVMAELPQKDVAAQLDLNLNTLKTLTRRAKIKLARMMAEANNG